MSLPLSPVRVVVCAKASPICHAINRWLQSPWIHPWCPPRRAYWTARWASCGAPPRCLQLCEKLFCTRPPFKLSSRLVAALAAHIHKLQCSPCSTHWLAHSQKFVSATVSLSLSVQANIAGAITQALLDEVSEGLPQKYCPWQHPTADTKPTHCECHCAAPSS